MQVLSLGGEDPLEKEMVTHSSIFAQKSHGHRSLVDYSPWGHKESDTTDLLTLSLSSGSYGYYQFPMLDYYSGLHCS